MNEKPNKDIEDIDTICKSCRQLNCFGCPYEKVHSKEIETLCDCTQTHRVQGTTPVKPHNYRVRLKDKKILQL